MTAKDSTRAQSRRPPRRRRSTLKGKYLVGQKLTDHEVELVLRAYAAGVTASDLVETFARARGERPTANTVFSLYDLIRTRLTEIRYFPDAQSYLEFHHTDETAKYVFPFSPAAQRLSAMSERLRGASERTILAHAAEIIFRAENPNHPAATMFRDIKLAVRITGPLNRTPINLDLWSLYWLILLQERMIAYLSAKVREGGTTIRDLFRESIVEHEQQLVRLKRSLRQKLRSLA